MSSKMKLNTIKKCKSLCLYDNFVPKIKPKSIESYPSPFILRISPLEEIPIHEDNFSLSNAIKETEPNICEYPQKVKKVRQSILNTLISKTKNSL